MSYRHSSFRKLKKAMKHAREQGTTEWTCRHEWARLMHWTVVKATPRAKPEGWGKPKRKG